MTPRTALSLGSPNVFNVRRDVSEQGLTYIWFYNDRNKAVSFQAEVNSLPISETYSWTGQHVEISSYRMREDCMVVDISLEPQDTMILAFEHSYHAGTLSSNDASKMLQTTALCQESSTRGQNSTVVSLKLWNITIDDWYGGYATQSLEPQTRQHVLLDQELLPWKDLRQDLGNVSGIETYTTTLVMPSTIPSIENADPSAV